MTGQLATVITQPVLLLKQKTNTTIHCLIPIHPKNWLSKIVDLCEFLSRFQNQFLIYSTSSSTIDSKGIVSCQGSCDQQDRRAFQPLFFSLNHQRPALYVFLARSFPFCKSIFHLKSSIKTRQF